MLTTAPGSETTAGEILAGRQLQDQRFLVTGASGGIGQETARALADSGASVILAARSEEKLARAKDAIAAATSREVDTLLLDLSSLDNVRLAAQSFLARYDSLDALINNAAVMACPLERTADDFEMQFGVGHLGHFLFTALLMPALLRTAPARVVNVTSVGHRRADVDLTDPNYRQRPYDKWEAYGQVKSANVLFSVGLTQRFARHGVTSNAVHPGSIDGTDLARHLTEQDLAHFSARQQQDTALRFKSLGAGAATTVWAATAPALRGKGGLYLEDCSIGKPCTSEAQSSGYLNRAVDPERAEHLWTLSERLVNEAFSRPSDQEENHSL